VKDFSTVVTSLFAISRDVTDARATLLEFASKKSHRRALVEQEQVLTHISALIQDQNPEAAQFGSELLRLLSEDSNSAIHISQNHRLFGVLIKTIQTENHPNRSLQLSLKDTILSITSSLPMDKGNYSESHLKWVSIIPSLIQYVGNISGETISKDDLKKSIIHLTESALLESKFV
jgi:hypothetical protein